MRHKPSRLGRVLRFGSTACVLVLLGVASDLAVGSGADAGSGAGSGPAPAASPSSTPARPGGPDLRLVLSESVDTAGGPVVFRGMPLRLQVVVVRRDSIAEVEEEMGRRRRAKAPLPDDTEEARSVVAAELALAGRIPTFRLGGPGHPWTLAVRVALRGPDGTALLPGLDWTARRLDADGAGPVELTAGRAVGEWFLSGEETTRLPLGAIEARASLDAAAAGLPATVGRSIESDVLPVRLADPSTPAERAAVEVASGNLELSRGRADGALAAAARAKALDRGAYEPLALEGQALFAQGRLVDAETAFQRAIQLFRQRHPHSYEPPAALYVWLDKTRAAQTKGGHP